MIKHRLKSQWRQQRENGGSTLHEAKTTFITWIKGAYKDSAFDGGGEHFDISSAEDKQNVTSDVKF
jgi:hypothetical protein